MTTITRNATRITDIDASIDRLKIAMTYLADKSTTGILAERMADLIIERQSLLDAKVAKPVATIAVAKATPVQTKPATVAKPRKPKAAKPAPVKAEPILIVANDKPVAAKPQKANYAGQMMLSGRGTASAGQKRWMAANGVKGNVIAIISMCAASNLRAKMTGKLA